MNTSRAKRLPGGFELATRILVLDDDRPILELYDEILTGEGYEVITSANPVDAAEIERLHPNLIILDYTFVVERWGAPIHLNWLPRGAANRIPLILCTAAPVAVRGTTAELQAQNIIVVEKPFDLYDFVAAVRGTLEPQSHPARLSASSMVGAL